MRRILTEENIVLQNMVQLALRDPNGGQEFAYSVLDVLPNDQEFMKQFTHIITSNLRK